MHFGILLLLVTSLPLWGQKIQLYLCDGSNLTVKEYKVLGDRVHYYSLERSQWEQIPLALVDLDQTRSEIERQITRRKSREQEDRIEQAALRKGRTELHNVPLEDGVYYSASSGVLPVEQASLSAYISKTRVFLQVLAPVPLLRKSTVEIDGTEAKLFVSDALPTFYVRLKKPTQVVILRLKNKKKSRLVRKIHKIAKDTKVMVEQEELEVFRQQLAPHVYKIWPVEPIAPGNYAVAEYVTGEENIRVWDFSYQHKASSVTSRIQ